MVDQSHPDFEKYRAEFEKIRSESIEAKKRIKPVKGVLDGPAVAIDRETAKKIKALQEKYKHLFY